MTKVKFLTNSQGIYGFSLYGHSSLDCDDEAGKLVCSAVSSAAYMAANTLVEIIGDETEAMVDDSFMRVAILHEVSSESKAVLEGFKLHISQLSVQYPSNIKIISEV